MKKRKYGIAELKSGKFQATVWFVDERGKRVKKEKTFPSRTLAKQWRNSFKTDIIRGEAKITTTRITLDDLLKRAMEHRRARLRARWPNDTEAKITKRLSRDIVAIRTLKQAAGPTRRVTKITSADIEKYIQLRHAARTNPRTINYELILIGHFFRLAPALFRELTHLVPPAIRLLPDSRRGRERTLTYDEEARIYSALEYFHRNMADFFLIAIDTAMRVQEILNLKPHNIHFDHPRFGKVGAIEVVATKVDMSKTIPMTSAVRDIMQRRCAETAPGTFIFPFDGVSRPAAQFRISRAFQMVSKELAIPYGRFTAGGWIIHDLRRTAINRMLARTHYDYSTVSKIAGLSIEIMLRSYARADEDQMITAITREKGVEKNVESSDISSV